MLPIGAINTQNYERGARKVNFFANPQVTQTGTVSTGEYNGGNITTNLENKTGTSNQFAMLPGGVETYMAKKLDYSA